MSCFSVSKWDVVTHVEKTSNLDWVTDSIGLTRNSDSCQRYTRGKKSIFLWTFKKEFKKGIAHIKIVWIICEYIGQLYLCNIIYYIIHSFVIQKLERHLRLWMLNNTRNIHIYFLTWKLKMVSLSPVFPVLLSSQILFQGSLCVTIALEYKQAVGWLLS